MNWFDKIVTKIGLDKIAHMFIIAFVATILAMIFTRPLQVTALGHTLPLVFLVVL